MSPKIWFRVAIDRIFTGLVTVFSMLLFVPLFFLLFYVVKNGISAISWSFFTHLPAPVGETGGGISNAIVGSLMLISIASVLAIPVGIAVGIYLAELRSSRAAGTVRLCVDILQGIPSIVVGMIAYVWVVRTMGHFSLISGCVALAIMMLPVVIRSTEETMILVSHELKEASTALGVPYFRTVLKVIIPSGFSGIMTGILLSVSRIAGETAPLLFTAFGNPFMNLDPGKPVNALPLMIFNYATSPYESWQTEAWGASLVLLVFVFTLNILAKVVSRR